MGEIRINLTNFITIGLMSYIGVWTINKALEKTGMSAWKA